MYMKCVLQILRCAQNDRKDARDDNGDPGRQTKPTNAVLPRGGGGEGGIQKKGERIRVCRMSLPLQGPAVTYSPTLPGSTIGAGGLNGSVRYG